jgi:hypothetical protein
MLPIFWANFLDHNKWSPKPFNNNKTKGDETISIPVSGGKNPPHTKMKYQDGNILQLPRLNFIQSCHQKKILVEYPFLVYRLLELPLPLIIVVVG